MAMEHLVLLAVFIAVSAGVYTLFEMIAVRKGMNAVKKNTKHLYNPELHQKPSLLQRLETKYNHSDYGQEIQETLKTANVDLSPAKWMLVYSFSWLAVTLLLQLLLGIGFPFNVLIAYLIVKVVVWRVFKSREGRLLKLVDKQLPDVCRLLASSVRAGLSINQGIENVAREIKAPLGPIFKSIHDELRMGIALSTALEKTSERVKSKNLKILNNTIIIQHKSGGNLSKVLEKMAETLEERERLQQEVKNNSTEGKFVSIVIIAFPIFLIIMLNFIIDDYIMPLFTLPGLILLTIVIFFMTTGVLLINKFSKIKV